MSMITILGVVLLGIGALETVEDWLRRRPGGLSRYVIVGGLALTVLGTL